MAVPEAPTQATSTGRAPVRLPWRYRHRRVTHVGVAVVLVAVAGAVAALVVLLRPFESDPDVARAALRDTRLVSDRAAGNAFRTRRLRDVRQAGREAVGDVKSIDGAIHRVRALDDYRYVRPVLEALRAQRGYAAEIAALRDLTDRSVGEWGARRVGLTVAQGRLRAARPAVAQLELGSLASLLPAPRRLELPVDHLAALIGHAARELKGWFRRLAGARRAQAAELQAALGYAGSVRAAFTEYEGLRADTQRWSTSVANDGSTYEAAYSYLASAIAARQALRTRLSAGTPPASLGPVHRAVLSVIDRSIEALTSAGEGLSDFQFQPDDTEPPPADYTPPDYNVPDYTPPDTEPSPSDSPGYDTGPDTTDPSYTDAAYRPVAQYQDYRDTPGWKSFVASSDDITSAWTSAKSSWEAALGSLIAAIKGRAMPRRPDV